jgi:hypothetical protein
MESSGRSIDFFECEIAAAAGPFLSAVANRIRFVERDDGDALSAAARKNEVNRNPVGAACTGERSILSKEADGR